MTFLYQYTDKDSNTPFICEFEWEPAEVGSVDSYGLKNEPDYPEQCYMLSMRIDDPKAIQYNLESIINEDLKESITKEALEAFNMEEI
jgi:hypothetical protein